MSPALCPSLLKLCSSAHPRENICVVQVLSYPSHGRLKSLKKGRGQYHQRFWGKALSDLAPPNHVSHLGHLTCGVSGG